MKHLASIPTLVALLLMAGCVSTGTPVGKPDTQVQLNRANYTIIATNVCGESSAMYLFGYSSGKSTSALFLLQGTGRLNQEANADFWRNFERDHGSPVQRKLAMANIRYDSDASNFFGLLTVPSVALCADVVEFLDAVPVAPTETQTLAAPAVESLPVVETTPVPIFDSAKVIVTDVAAAVVPDSAKIKLKCSDPIPLNQSGYVWVVAAYSKLDKANARAHDFRKQGYRTEVLTGIHEGKKVFRVAMGHFGTLDELLSTRALLPDGVSDPWTLRIQ